MSAAALRGLVESGALVPISTGWRVEPLAMADLQSSRHAAAFLARRIELLPEATIKLLSVGAVLGKEFDLFTASKLARQTSAQAIVNLFSQWYADLAQPLCQKTDIEVLRPAGQYLIAYHQQAGGRISISHLQFLVLFQKL